MKGERGFALVMVLILLALGSLMIVPGMQLMRTVLTGRAIYAQDIRHDYAAGSAIEYGMWRVLYDPGYAESLTPEVPDESLPLTVNGVQATTTVLIYASTGGLSGVALAKDYQILPTKAVFPSTAQPGVSETFIYVITMKRLEPDDAQFDPLQSVKDGLDLGFTYVPGTSKWDDVPFADDDMTVLDEDVRIDNERWESPVFTEADAMVREDNPDQNYGIDTTMDVQSLVGGNARSFVRFDISAIPAGSTIENADLVLCATAVPSPSRTYEVYRVTGTWDESTITWNNPPAVAVSRTDKDNTPGTPGCMQWDVKDDVQAWVGGTEPNYGWQIRAEDENSPTAETTTFRTREDTIDPNKQPVLDVEIDPGYETIEWIFNPSFIAGLAFGYGEEHTLTFEATATNPADNTRYCNVAEVRPEENNTGLTAPITVGIPTYNGCPGGGIIVTKTADPPVILPGVLTEVTYVISIINNDIGGFIKLDSIEDYLPPGFTYIAGSASAQWTNTAPFDPDTDVYGYSSPDNALYGSPVEYNICDFEPQTQPQADGRWKLTWHAKKSANGFNSTLNLCHDYPLPYGATYTQTFQALAELDKTGSYYNEVIVKLKDADRYGGDRGMGEWDESYTGPTGETVVPYIDFQGATDISTLRSNAKWTPTGLTARSWHWKKHR